MADWRNKYRYVGFTIVELLVVIVIIGIIASITLISYASVSQRASIATIVADLSTAHKKFKLHQTEYGGYPTFMDCDDPISSTNTCVKLNSNNQLTFTVANEPTDNQKFCLTIKNISINKKYYITQDGLPTFGSCPLPPPTNLAITSTLDSSVVLNWDEIAGATYYKLQRDVDPLFPNPVDIGTTLATSATADGLSASTTYYFRLMAIAGDDTTLWSTVISTTTTELSSLWIAGVQGTELDGKFVYYQDLPTTYAWSSGFFPCAVGSSGSAQCEPGIDPFQNQSMVLTSPQLYSSLDFSQYPAQDACKAIGGRLPMVWQLLSIYDNQATYGFNFQPANYFTATELPQFMGGEIQIQNAFMVNFSSRSVDMGQKTIPLNVRCIKD